MVFSPRPSSKRRCPPVALLLEHDSTQGIAKAVCQAACRLYTDDSHPPDTTPTRVHEHAQFGALRYDAVWNCVHEVRLLRLEPKGDFSNVDGNGVCWEDVIPVRQLDAVIWCIDREATQDMLFEIRTNLMDLRLKRLPSRVGLGILVWGPNGPKTKAVMKTLDIGALGRVDPIQVFSLRPRQEADRRFIRGLELALKWVYDRPPLDLERPLETLLEPPLDDLNHAGEAEATGEEAE